MLFIMGCLFLEPGGCIDRIWWNTSQTVRERSPPAARDGWYQTCSCGARKGSDLRAITQFPLKNLFILGVAVREPGRGSRGTGAELPLHSPRLPAALCPALSQPGCACTAPLRQPGMGQKNCKPQPGDLIEIFRPFYQHWALYVGDGYVIHLTSVDDESSSLWLSSSSIGATRGKVKKQRLEEVVGKNRWRVNNKYDRKRTPRPVKEIIHDAEQWIDEEVTYDALTDNCEHFVTELRYGKGVSRQLPLHSPRLPAALCPALSQPGCTCTAPLRQPGMGQKNCKPQPGDLIEIFRPFYQHWALYVGDGYVIHLTSVAVFSRSRGNPCEVLEGPETICLTALSPPWLPQMTNPHPFGLAALQ
ncbi:uncharacterized protein VK521_005756 isoform 2-T2 [Ammospiza maritima maritima]